MNDGMHRDPITQGPVAHTMSGITPGRWQAKSPILSRNVDQKSIETVFLIAICCPTGNKWQSKTLFLSIFDPCLRFQLPPTRCGYTLIKPVTVTTSV